ncbi:hypothetical protein ACET64_17500 [Aeromonas veronii]
MARAFRISGRQLFISDVVAQKDAIEKALLLSFSHDNPNYNADFVGMTVAEVNDLKEARLNESEMTHSLILLAAIEAKIRADANTRHVNRYKDPLSRKIRALYRDRKNIKLEDHLISARTEVEPQNKRFYDELRRALKYRHWLAHGRYWTMPNAFDFTQIALIISNLESNSNFYG